MYSAKGPHPGGATGAVDLHMLADSRDSPRSEDDQPRPLDPHYYRDNFVLMLRGARDLDPQLLSASEAAFCDHFEALSREAQCLYVRLVSRRGPLFRCDRLDYPEIGPIDHGLHELLRRGFLDDAPDAGAAQLLALLRRQELADLAGRLLGALAWQRWKRRDLEVALLGRVTPDHLSKAVRATIRVVRPRHRASLETLRLLYFGNLRQDWSTMMLDEMRLWRHESYEIHNDLHPFRQRRAIDDTLRLRDLRCELRAAGGAPTVDLLLSLLRRLAAPRWHPVTERQRSRLLLVCGRELERRGRSEAALAAYRVAARPPARERRVRILRRLGRRHRAAEILSAMANDPMLAGEGETARRLAGRRRGLPPLQSRSIELAQGPGERVELLLADHLRRQGARVVFSENWLWCSLFGLAFWDLVFAPVAGAFTHPFQAAPHDLLTPDFRQRRAAAIEDRLDDLSRQPRLGERLLKVWERKRGLRNLLVTWTPAARDGVETVLGVLSGAELAPICDRMSTDLRRYRRGFPDLFVIHDGRWELLEVKAPGDALRPEQTAWLRFMAENDMVACEARIRWRSAAAAADR